MNLDNHNYYGDNLEESEFGQLHAMHLSMNAVNSVRQRIIEQARAPRFIHCVECGKEIPQARRIAVVGCRLCLSCKYESEQ